MSLRTNTIISLENNEKYVVLNETMYGGTKYFLVMGVDENKDVMFCKYCGSKLIVDNDNEYIHKKVDVADVKRAETEQLVKLKELEMKEKENEHKKEVLRIKIKSSIIL